MFLHPPVSQEVTIHAEQLRSHHCGMRLDPY